MIEFSMIETLIMTYAPMITTLIGVIITFVKMVNQMKQLRKDNLKSLEEKQNEIDTLRDDFKMLLQKDYENKQIINQLLTKLDGIKRGE